MISHIAFFFGFFYWVARYLVNRKFPCWYGTPFVSKERKWSHVKALWHASRHLGKLCSKTGLYIHSLGLTIKVIGG